MKLIKKFRKEHGRIAYYYELKSFNKALKLVPKGYRIYPQSNGSYLCQLPERVLFDLSDLNLPFPFSKDYPIKIHKYIKKNISRILEEGRKRYGLLLEITGNCLQGQIRIAGGNTMSLKAFINDFLTNIPKKLNDEFYNDQMVATPVMKEEVNKNIWRREVEMFYNSIKKKYQNMCLSKYKHFMEIYNCYTAFYHPIWYEINKLGSQFVFFLQSGIKLALGFIQATRNTDSVFLIERHISQDYYSCFRKKPLIYQKFGKYQILSTTLLIDHVLSGNTLKEVKSEEPLCKVLALFPKSHTHLKLFDWIVYNSCLIPTNEIPQSNDWFLKLFKSTEKIRRDKYDIK